MKTLYNTQWRAKSSGLSYLPYPEGFQDTCIYCVVHTSSGYELFSNLIGSSISSLLAHILAEDFMESQVSLSRSLYQRTTLRGMKNRIHINLTLQRTAKKSLFQGSGGRETRRCEFKTRSRQGTFRCFLHLCYLLFQNNTNLVFHKSCFISFSGTKMSREKGNLIFSTFKI